MSVVITLKFPGDVAKFRQAITEHADQFAKMASEAKASGGGIHHRFAVGDGFVLVVDEWETVEHFQKFFANPDLQALVMAAGATGEPEVTVAEAVTSADQY